MGIVMAPHSLTSIIYTHIPLLLIKYVGSFSFGNPAMIDKINKTTRHCTVAYSKLWTDFLTYAELVTTGITLLKLRSAPQKSSRLLDANTIYYLGIYSTFLLQNAGVLDDTYLCVMQKHDANRFVITSPRLPHVQHKRLLYNKVVQLSNVIHFGH